MPGLFARKLEGALPQSLTEREAAQSRIGRLKTVQEVFPASRGALSPAWAGFPLKVSRDRVPSYATLLCSLRNEPQLRRLKTL